MNMRIPPRTFALNILGASLAVALAPSPAAEAQTALPRFDQLKAGWNTLTPGGRTGCALGADYHFFVRPGASDRLLVYFGGGGACWNGKDCEQGRPLYNPDAAVRPDLERGIFDIAKPQNPFTAYSVIAVAYCTGDVHLGDQ